MRRLHVVIAALGLVAAACGDTAPAEPESDAARLVDIIPANGSVDVAVGTRVVLEFTHPMAAGMEAYIALKEGSVTGRVIGGTWSWSPDRTRLTLMPEAPLKPNTLHVIHLGGGLQAGNGVPVNWELCQQEHGGQWVTGAMLGWATGAMGPGWHHANGSYGMVFSFVTA